MSTEPVQVKEPEPKTPPVVPKEPDPPPTDPKEKDKLDKESFYKKSRSEGKDKALKDVAKAMGLEGAYDEAALKVLVDKGRAAVEADKSNEERLAEASAKNETLNEKTARQSQIIEDYAKIELEKLPDHIKALVLETCGEDTELQLAMIRGESFQKVLETSGGTGRTIGKINNQNTNQPDSKVEAGVVLLRAWEEDRGNVGKRRAWMAFMDKNRGLGQQVRKRVSG